MFNFKKPAVKTLNDLVVEDLEKAQFDLHAAQGEAERATHQVSFLSAKVKRLEAQLSVGVQIG